MIRAKTETFSNISGTSSKCVFERRTYQLFLMEEELFIWSNFYLRNHLQTILQTDYRYIVFITANIIFQKIADPGEKTNIFSSFRNRNWIVPTDPDPNEILGIVDSLLASFCRQFCYDVQDIENRQQSGWSYMLCESFECKYLRRPPGQILGYAKIGPPTNKILPSLKQIFLRNVILPERLAPHKAVNQCILINIILRLEHIHKGTLVHTTKKKIKEALQHIKTTGVQSLIDGIEPKDFRKIEKANENFSPKLIQMYPLLRMYRGFAINLFQVIHNPTFNTYNLYPIALSEVWNKEDYISIDMIKNSKALYQHCPKFYPNHALLITNYVRFVTNFNRNSLGRNTRTIARVCRSCGTKFFDYQMNEKNSEFIEHVQTCKSHNAQSAIATKKITNKVMYRSHRFCKYQNKMKQNFLQFPVSKYHTTLKPALFGALDFEATNIPMDYQADSFLGLKGVPKTSIMVQKPLAYSHNLCTPYKNLVIPPELAEVKIKFLDEKKNSIEDFYMDLLISLRQKLLQYDNFLTKILEKGRIPPKWESLTLEEKITLLTTHKCGYCGKSNLTGLLHHNHLEYEDPEAQRNPGTQKPKGPRLARTSDNKNIIILCYGCNLNTFNDGYKQKAALTYFCHGLERYDR